MVDGRTRTGKVVNRLKQGNASIRAPVEQRTPIASDMYLPNHSGISSHPEFKSATQKVCLIADNYGSIQDAIDALPETGGCVKLSNKTYEIDSAIVISNSYVNLEGAGKSSIIKVANGANCNAIEITAADIYYCNLRDFTIDGNKANNTGGVGVYISTAETTADEPYFIIENLWIHDMDSHGIEVTNDPQEIWFSQIRIRDCGGNGFELDGFDHKLNQCVVSECDGEGFNFPSTASNIKLVNCKAYNNDNGFKIVGNGHFYFTQCQAQEAQNRGFDFQTGTGSEKVIILNGCVSDGNYLSGTGGNGEGVYINNRNNVQIIGGEFGKTGGAGNQTYGIRIEGTSTDCLVNGAEFRTNVTSNYTDNSSGTNMVLANQGYTDDNLGDHTLSVETLKTDELVGKDSNNIYLKEGGTTENGGFITTGGSQTAVLHSDTANYLSGLRTQDNYLSLTVGAGIGVTNTLSMTGTATTLSDPTTFEDDVTCEADLSVEGDVIIGTTGQKTILSQGSFLGDWFNINVDEDGDSSGWFSITTGDNTIFAATNSTWQIQTANVNNTYPEFKTVVGDTTIGSGQTLFNVNIQGLDSGLRTGATIQAVTTAGWGSNTNQAPTRIRFACQDNTTTNRLTTYPLQLEYNAIGFMNTTPVTLQTVTGSTAGNAALQNLLTAMANYGLIVDSTT